MDKDLQPPYQLVLYCTLLIDSNDSFDPFLQEAHHEPSDAKSSHDHQVSQGIQYTLIRQ